MRGASFTQRQVRLVGDVRPPLDVVLQERAEYLAPEKVAVAVEDLIANNSMSMVDAFKEFVSSVQQQILSFLCLSLRFHGADLVWHFSASFLR